MTRDLVRDYLVVLEDKDGQAVVIHQSAPTYLLLLEHVAGLIGRSDYIPKAADPAVWMPNGRVKAIVPADYLPIPGGLL